MDITVLLFLSSGLFLGWSLGANDAANVFGTAVGTRMVKFTTAAIVCSICIILGAVISGSGAAHTLGKLGAINAIGGSFMAAFSAGFTVYWMTKLCIPVSTSQAVVGAIIGWNLFSGSPTDVNSLFKIVGTWVACPVLAAIIAIPVFWAVKAFLHFSKIHLLRLDAYTRMALIIIGGFGSYALGANNIANVMGVFIPSSPFTDFDVDGLFTFTGIQQLFMLGGIAIAVGVFTYSKRVMLTVGDGLMTLSPITAWVVVFSHSVVLFLFASEGLEHFLAIHNLPTIPLVPVSSSQAVVGAVIGIGLIKGGRGIKWNVLLKISSGWITTPIISATICFVSLFFLQNVFNQEVYRDVPYVISDTVVAKLNKQDFPVKSLDKIKDVNFKSVRDFRKTIKKELDISRKDEQILLNIAVISKAYIDPKKFEEMSLEKLTEGQVTAIKQLKNKTFMYRWEFKEALAKQSDEWKPLPENKKNKLKNKHILQDINRIHKIFAVENL